MSRPGVSYVSTKFDNSRHLQAKVGSPNQRLEDHLIPFAPLSPGSVRSHVVLLAQAPQVAGAVLYALGQRAVFRKAVTSKVPDVCAKETTPCSSYGLQH